MFKRILVASDLTPASRPALRMALQLGCQFSASVVALHVMSDAAEPTDRFRAGTHALGAGIRVDPLLRREEQATRLRLERQTRSELPDGPAPPTEALVRFGPTAESILAVAQAGEADLIVVGAGTVPGQVSEVATQVMRDAGRPVLAVPADADELDDVESPRYDRRGAYAQRHA